ncbi:hypothetical protein [Mesorhizobium silamurunense]|uniref:hypothetical protein n=1 Tax=Mesorhizobium silamurunense TaxID=499528 RepID=UPI00177F7C58|nr:hypothetical protein [Mesorhizobium silamurunense]
MLVTHCDKKEPGWRARTLHANLGFAMDVPGHIFVIARVTTPTENEKAPDFSGA